MVVYLDLVFLLNFVADALALYVTSRLSGVTINVSRVLLASFVGGIYGSICAIPSLAIANEIFVQTAMASILVWIVFGKIRIFLRLMLLFFVLSCAMVGVLIAFVQTFALCGVSNTLHSLNWKVFFLAGGMCYFFLSVVFRGSASHRVAGEMYDGVLYRNGRIVKLNVLLDTGHTLTDPYNDSQVVTVWLDAVKNLLSNEEREILAKLSIDGAASCCEKLARVSPGVFRLVPYRAVGTVNGVLLGFSVEKMELNGNDLGKITAAVTATPLSDGEGTNALWGGSKEWEKGNLL